MDYSESQCVHHAFRSFVCLALSLLIAFHGYAYLWGPADSGGEGFGEVKYVVLQLSKGLTEASENYRLFRYFCFKTSVRAERACIFVSLYEIDATANDRFYIW